MPRPGAINYVMSNGVETDFSALLQRFVKTNSVRYEHFAEIWREMNMSLIFAGRQRDQEVRQFTEECLNIIKAYIQPSSEFQIQIGGLYLLYAVYFKQLFLPKVKIRMTLAQWVQLQNVMTEVKAQNHSDIEYIYHRLMYDNAFHLTAHTTGLSLLDRDNFEDEASRAARVAQGALAAETDKAPRSFVTEMAEGDAVDQLSSIHEQYHRVKCALVGPSAKKPAASLDMIDPNIVQHITKKIASFEWWKKYKAGKRGARRRHDSGPTTSESEADSESERSYSPKKSRSVGSIRAEIKARAMGSSAEVSRSRRHRSVRSLSALDSQESSSTPSRKAKGSHSYQESSEDEEHDPSWNLQDGDLPSMPALRHLEEPQEKKKKTRRRKGQPKEPKPRQSRKKKAKDSANTTINSSIEAQEEKTGRGRKRKSTKNTDPSLKVEKVEQEKKRKRQSKVIKTEPQANGDAGIGLSGKVKAEESTSPAKENGSETGMAVLQEDHNNFLTETNDISMNSGDQGDIDSEQSQLNISLPSSALPAAEVSPKPSTSGIKTPRGRGRPPKKRKM